MRRKASRTRKNTGKSRVWLWVLILALILGACSGIAGDDESDQTEEPPAVTEVDQEKDADDKDAAEEPEEPKKEDPSAAEDKSSEQKKPKPAHKVWFSVSDIPEYTGSAYAAVNGNYPYFKSSELTDRSFEEYAPLDSQGRCGTAVASIGTDLMPTEERGSIGQVKPTGWHTIRYDCVDGKYLYNRCHLIGYQLSGENANTRNLITGTRYLNIEGMLPFENMVADYVKETDNHVMYRVTPIFDGDNPLAEGVLMEGYSVEDDGDGICYCVFAYNVQPGVVIDYTTGDSYSTEPEPEPEPEHHDKKPAPEKKPAGGDVKYILNTNSKKFHYPDCSSVDSMSEKNKEEYTGPRQDLIDQGYDPCKRCNP